MHTTPAYTIAALYRFVTIQDPATTRNTLHALCQEHGIKGTLLLAEEGINGTVAGSTTAIAQLKSWFIAQGLFEGMEYKESFADLLPFHRLKVRVKREIVTMGRPEAQPSQQVGTYVDPQEWNALLADPDVLVIDTRNHYEVAIGTFQGAINPNTTHFREFPDYVAHHLTGAKQKKIAIYCTGGIRCEKASSFLLNQQFEHVYHLKGGILKYLETMPAEESKWQGECFVFDQRVAVQEKVEVGHYAVCYGCRHPITAADKASPQYEEGVSCPHCYDSTSPEKKARARERQRQVMLAEQHQRTPHIGVPRA